jgi:hypothetical protein
MSCYTRRNFIKQAVASTGTFAFATGCRHLLVTDRNDLSRRAIERLRTKLKGRLILPADPSYESTRRVFYWNAATERRPLVIVQCAHEEDVLRAVEFARRHELEVAARAGGHSHLGWGCSNGLVIDLSGMKRITIDLLRRTARAEGGVLSGEVARAAARAGARTMSWRGRAALFLAAGWAGSPDCTALPATISSPLAW